MGGSHIFEGECNGNARKDGKFVIFKKLEKVGEPFSCNYYGDGRLVMMQEYQLFDSNVIYCYQTPPMYITDYKHKRIAIEIKQNKKDMEEKKLNLKPFDIQKAKDGKPVYTRDGRKARIICFDRDWDMSIVALVSGPLGESVHYYLSNGKINLYTQNDEDLMMYPEKKEGWVNVYKGGLLDTKSYPTQKEALDKANSEDYIATVKIEWEE